jgi:ankyrin repeat protein
MKTISMFRTKKSQRFSSALILRRITSCPWGVLAVVLGFALTVFTLFPSKSFAGHDLIKATEEGRIEIVVDLLANGADVNVRNADGISSLHIAQLSADVRITKMLLSAGAEVDARDRSGETPLMIACFNGRTDNAEMLLTQGANINARDIDSRTALGFSMRMRKPETVRVLLARGADPNVACKSDGKTPLMLAIGTEQFGDPMGEWAFSQDHLAIVVDLLKSGANIDAKDKSGETALMKAVRTGKVEIIKALLDKGAQTQLKNDQLQTAADIATAMGHKKIVDVLANK